MFAASKTASASGGYQISRSLRFNSPDTAYLNRTIATTSNRQTFTLSFWCKLGTISTTRYLYSANINGNNEFTMGFETTNIFFVYDYQTGYFMNLVTTQLFRDPSAWYHIVVAIDTTQATSSNRVKIYVNETQVTSFSTAVYPPQNYNTLVNSSSCNLVTLIIRAIYLVGNFFLLVNILFHGEDNHILHKYVDLCET
jgi:hypothetical protein